MSVIQQTSTVQPKAKLISGALVVSVTILFCLVLTGLLFPAGAAGAIRVWMDSPTFNHCFLIVPLSLFMIWQRRNEIDLADLRPALWAATGVLALSLAWAVVSFVGVLEVEQFVIVAMAQTMLLAFFGTTLYRKLAGPLLYLFFLVPSGAFLIPALQAFTARFSVAGLHLLGIPVFSTGAVIEIPAGTFAIAEACAGLRFLIASIAFGVFFAIVTYRSTWRRALFIALSIAVPIVANGIRALGLIAAAEWIGSPAAALADHIIYGWIFFSIVLVALVLIGNLFSDRKTPGGLKPDAMPIPEIPLPFARISLVALLCAAMALIGPLAAAAMSVPRAIALPQSAPRVSAPWRPADLTPDWTPLLVRPSRTFAQAFVMGPYKIDRYVAIYDGDGRTSNLIRSDNRDADEKEWTFDSSSGSELTIGNQVIPVRVSTWLRGPEKRKVWSFYVVNGRPLASPLRAKWEQLREAFGGQRCVPAYFGLSAEAINGVPDVIGVEKVMAATEPLKGYLCEPRQDQSIRAN